MGGDSGSKAPDLDFLKQLSDSPHKFSFFMAVRRLDCLFADSPRTGKALRPREEQIRFGQTPSLGFPPSTLDSFEQRATDNRWLLATHFFGLFGPHGPLPIHLTEYAYEREHNSRDQTLRRFVDIFHHRMLELFYAAWADAQPTVQFDRPETDEFSKYVGSLFGIGMPSLRDRDRMPDRAKLFFAGHLSCQTRHPQGLKDLLESFLRIPVELHEFVGHWITLPADCRMLLGTSREGATLGKTATVGARVWDCQQNFRIDLGPMDYAAYRRFLPGGSSLKSLQSIVRNYSGDSLRWELRLTLKKEQVPTMQLGRTGSLGWSSWLSKSKRKRDADDLVLHPKEG